MRTAARKAGSLILWEGNGNTVLPAIHFALGYGHYRGFPEDYEDVKKDVENFIPKLKERYQDGEILFMQYFKISKM